MSRERQEDKVADVYNGECLADILLHEESVRVLLGGKEIVSYI